MCLANKGSFDLERAYTNTAAGWAETLFNGALPWDVQSPYCDLVGFSQKMLQPDILHCWHLGCGRDLAGGVLSVLVRRRDVFKGGRIERRFATASRDLHRFARNHGYTVSRKKLTRQSLNMKAGKYPELLAKGHDTTVIIKWLLHIVQERDLGIPLIATALWAADNCLTLIHHANEFLSLEEVMQLRCVGKLFVNTYLQLAAEAIRQQKLLWKCRPKLHLVDHIFRMERKSFVNPRRYSTWMDEDALKKFMRVNKMTHKNTAATRVLQRWLLGLPRSFAEQSEDGKKHGAAFEVWGWEKLKNKHRFLRSPCLVGMVFS